MRTATRRGFLAGAASSAAVPAFARPAEAAKVTPLAKRVIVRRGRAIAVSPRGDRLVVAHDHRRTIAIQRPGRSGSRLVDVGGQPLSVAIAPGGRLAAVTTAFWDEPGVAFVDLATGKLRARVRAGAAPFDLAFTPDGKRLIVSGGEQEGSIAIVDAHRFKTISMAPIGTLPRGVAMAPKGDRVWIALSGLDRVIGVDLKTGRIRRRLVTPELPDRVALSPDGRRLLVSHGGRGAGSVSEIVIATGRRVSRRAGRLPSGVAWTRSGLPVVALGGAGQVVTFDKKRRPHLHKAGAAPRGLAVAGRSAWTVDALTGAVHRVRV